jgi:tellurite resistance protein TehA-like permease
MPLTLLIIFSMVVGYAFSFIFSYKKFRAKDLEIDELKKEIKELKSDN